jgi:hypothetical protein
MNSGSLRIAALAALLWAGGAAAGAECTAPGVLVFEDPAGDTGVPVEDAARVPVPDDNADMLSLHIAEAGNRLVFTYRMASLAQPLASAGYILRLSTEERPAEGDDWFVAMFTDTEGAPSFVYGRSGAVSEAPSRWFFIDGELDGASTYSPDGAITLVIDRSRLPGASPGLDLYPILPTVRLLSPTADTLGQATNGDNATILDDAPGDWYYTVSGACAEARALETGSGLLAGGAPSPLTLSLILLPALRRRRATGNLP